MLLLTCHEQLPIDVINGGNIASCRCRTESRHKVSLKCNWEQCRDSLLHCRAQGSCQNSTNVVQSCFHGKDVFLHQVVHEILRQLKESYELFRHVYSTLVYLFIELLHTLPNLSARNCGTEYAT